MEFSITMGGEKKRSWLEASFAEARRSRKMREGGTQQKVTVESG
jgi:hypothetical protein